jgi:deoxyribodipyrimidine photo-lyase
LLYTPNKNLRVHGGRPNAQAQLGGLSLKGYKEKRDYPSIDATSILSAHLKFGTLSIREVFHHIQRLQGDTDMFISELLWRDFFYHIAYTYPYVFGSAFKKKFNKLPWKNDHALFKAWCSGQTGFPIVDAGMRELNATGYMHNRVRMITASFLIKNLHIDWKWGEKYFAQKLIDYDPCVNNGNWQWAASTGCDAQPYFRIFNPWSQQKRFDEETTYIKKWVPELAEIEPKVIHNWADKHTDYPQIYTKPVVSHSETRLQSLEMYKNIK